jgi:hypothetical protein
MVDLIEKGGIMHEARRSESGGKTEKGVKERQSEATSKDTLTDLEQSQKISGSKPPRSAPASVPSPDGQEDDEHRNLPDDPRP